MEVRLGGELFRAEWDELAFFPGSLLSDLYELHVVEGAGAQAEIHLVGDPSAFAVVIKALRLARKDLGGALVLLNEEVANPSKGPLLMEMLRYLRLEWLLGVRVGPPLAEASMPASISFPAMTEHEGGRYGLGRHLDHASEHIGQQIPIPGVLQRFAMRGPAWGESCSLEGTWYFRKKMGLLNGFLGGASRIRIAPCAEESAVFEWAVDEEDGALPGTRVHGTLVEVAEQRWRLKVDGGDPIALFEENPAEGQVHARFSDSRPGELCLDMAWEERGGGVQGRALVLACRARSGAEVLVLVQRWNCRAALYRRCFHLLPHLGVPRAGEGPPLGGGAELVLDLGRGNAVRLEAAAILLSHTRSGLGTVGMLSLHGLSELSSYEHTGGGGNPWRRVPANGIRQLASQRFDRAQDRCWLYLRVLPERRWWFRMLHLALHDPHVNTFDRMWRGAIQPAPRRAEDDEAAWAVDYIELFGTYVELPAAAVEEAMPARGEFRFNGTPKEVSVALFEE